MKASCKGGAMAWLLTLCVVLGTVPALQAGYISEPLATYDFIVVGGGAAGCVVASRLSENPSLSILLIEAGDKTQASVGGEDWVGRGVTRSDEPFIAYTTFTYRDDYYWPFDVNVGKGIGGGGIVNGMRWVRALEYDFQKWNASGWNYKTMLPYYIKTENNTGNLTQNSQFHGYAGPIEVSDPVYESLESTYFVQSAIANGLPFLADFNADPLSRIGAGYHQYNIRKGIRDSTANAYLAPALRRSNLHVLVHAQVIKIEFAGTQAVGVQYILNEDLSRVISVNTTREIILTAGAINTAKLLLLSGVGNKTELAKLNIKSVVDLPGVGMHFQDHPLIFYNWEVKHSVDDTMGSYIGWQQQYDVDKTGILATIDRAGLFANSGKHPNVPKNVPDVQISMEADATYGAFVIEPESANGTIKLKTSNPLDAPLIVDPMWSEYIEDNDVEALVWLLAELEAILSQPPMSTVVGERLAPPSTLSQAEVYQYVKDNIQSGNHLVGTCRMGNGHPEDVVDLQLRVVGLKGIRIADASIIPTITNGNQQANVIAIAERAVDLIKQTMKST